MDGRSQKHLLWGDCGRVDYIYDCGGDNDNHSKLEEMMTFLKPTKSAMVVSEAGIHIVVDDILTPKEVVELIKELRDSLFKWSKLTGKRVDDPACH